MASYKVISKVRGFEICHQDSGRISGPGQSHQRTDEGVGETGAGVRSQDEGGNGRAALEETSWTTNGRHASKDVCEVPVWQNSEELEGAVAMRDAVNLLSYLMVHIKWTSSAALRVQYSRNSNQAYLLFRKG